MSLRASLLSRRTAALALCALLAGGPALAADASDPGAAPVGVTQSGVTQSGISQSGATQSDVSVQFSAFRQALATAIGGDKVLVDFYRARDDRPLWTGIGDAPRRQAFFDAIATAGAQGLPQDRYDPATLAQDFRAVQTEGDRGRLEARMSRTFLRYAHDVQTGVLRPASVSSDLAMKVPLRDPLKTIENFAASDPAAYLAKLPPQMPQYRRLVKAKLDMQHLIADGGWGPVVNARKLRPGDTGPAVVALRNRLMAMGYLGRTASASYDGDLQAAVQIFQDDHGLTPDGVAGADTLRAINTSATDRLKSIIVALERLRWLNMPWGNRYVWVNEADFTASVIDDGKTVFSTRAIVGKNDGDTRSPEFSNSIQFMIVNPVWNVPRSIATKEYLPMLQKNPNAVSYLNIVNAKGQVVDRSTIDFSEYTKKTFPYEIKQPPSRRNALGLVKFMFPNRFNIYLHDTPAKSLFQHETRAFSHGCIRLNDPFDLAYTLLAPQTSDPKGVFQRALRTGRETTIMLDKPVPVHLTYFTAWPTPKGGMTYRHDIYGRDALIWAALSEAGVALGDVQG
jgi:murein L,D-transpeptidase YcbB/YkuD